MKRYETLAHTIADEIRNGNLAVGTRLPSLRQIIAQHGVSQSTVFRAYYLLEQWGLIRARERSGYYVAPDLKEAIYFGIFLLILVAHPMGLFGTAVE